VRFVVVLVATVTAGLLILALDFTVSLVWRPGTGGQQIRQPYVARERGWYELERNFTGVDKFGPLVFDVHTDAHGFRRKPGSGTPGAADVIFLGDSFTYGINGAWEDTFVGIFAEQSRQTVINAGVPSYSPTAYLYQYQRALSNGLLKPGHRVVVAIDISDVQDEAGVWVDGPSHPYKRQRNIEDRAGIAPPAAPRQTAVDRRAKIIDALPNSFLVYRFIRYDLLGWERLELLDLPRSAFTFKDWADLDSRPVLPSMEGFGPLGIASGLSRIEEKLGAIIDLARGAGASVHVLIYPWPAQLARSDRFSWSEFIASACARRRCTGVVDTIPVFRELAASNRRWYGKYYVSGDTHFNSAGNRVVADVLLAAFATNR
jgi:hypothetical protein